MERGIVHYNHGTLVKTRQKQLGKPAFKKAAVHGSAILKRRKDLLRHFRSHKAAPFILFAADSCEHLLAPRRISIFPVQVCIYTTFIHIGDLFWRYVLDLLLVCRYFLRILLLVAGSLFFRVIPYRLSALRIPLSLHPNASAISD